MINRTKESHKERKKKQKDKIIIKTYIEWILLWFSFQHPIDVIFWIVVQLPLFAQFVVLISLCVYNVFVLFFPSSLSLFLSHGIICHLSFGSFVKWRGTQIPNSNLPTRTNISDTNPIIIQVVYGSIFRCERDQFWMTWFGFVVLDSNYRINPFKMALYFYWQPLI